MSHTFSVETLGLVKALRRAGTPEERKPLLRIAIEKNHDLMLHLFSAEVETIKKEGREVV